MLNVLKPGRSLVTVTPWLTVTVSVQLVTLPAWSRMVMVTV